MTEHVAHGSFDDFPPVDATAGRFPRAPSSGAFQYEKRVVMPKSSNELQVAFMELPPGKSGYPYHWHDGVTECYVILDGTGLVRTPDGEFEVRPGHVVVFPRGPVGAHRMTNIGDVPLRYVDIDTTADPDVFHYPDSGKSGFMSSFVAGVFRDADRVGYYDGEPDAR